jgi:2-methylcitrate dehydratase
MTLPRRQFLHLAAGAASLPAASRLAWAQTDPARSLHEQPTRPLAERLATYADGLRYDDLDDATIERVVSTRSAAGSPPSTRSRYAFAAT